MKPGLFKKFFAQWENNEYTIRFYQVVTLTLVLLLFVAISGIIYTAQNTRTVLVPTNLEKSIWVSGKEASDDYFAEMATYFANYRLTFSPDTADYQFKNLLKYVTPQASGVLSSELKVLATDVKGKNYAQVFYPIAVQVVDRQKHIFSIEGSERHFIGSQQVEELGKKYLMRFELLNGKIYVAAFKESKQDQTAAETTVQTQ